MHNCEHDSHISGPASDATHTHTHLGVWLSRFWVKLSNHVGVTFPIVCSHLINNSPIPPAHAVWWSHFKIPVTSFVWWHTLFLCRLHRDKSAGPTQLTFLCQLIGLLILYRSLLAFTHSWSHFEFVPSTHSVIDIPPHYISTRIFYLYETAES